MPRRHDRNTAKRRSMINVEEIIEDAEVAAVYFRALLTKEVPPSHAAYMTNSYISSRQIARASNEKPKEPWEEK